MAGGRRRRALRRLTGRSARLAAAPLRSTARRVEGGALARGATVELVFRPARGAGVAVSAARPTTARPAHDLDDHEPDSTPGLGLVD